LVWYQQMERGPAGTGRVVPQGGAF
jgi:hypothetical protein